MMNDISVSGIQTNNLNNISVVIKKNALNLILGPSGSGKTSLAYDTIAQIGLHELGAMYYDSMNEPEYKVRAYSNMLVTIPIRQVNNNNNVRSTVGTYFSLSSCLSKIFSAILKVPYDYFVLNKSENICQSCSGIGYIKSLDLYKIVDYNKTVEEVPVRCWRRNKDFYRQILRLYCIDLDIPYKTKFRHLTDMQKEQVLYGIGQKKYTIKYKVTNHLSSRTTAYYGPMTGVAMMKDFSPSAEFYSERPCKNCSGEKYEINHRKHKICEYSIGELLLVPFENLVSWIDVVWNRYPCDEFEFSLSQIKAFAKKAIELKLGYIFLNRSIPSLSGGELQRLRLIQVFNSQLTDLLIVLDEPLAGLSSREKDAVYNNIIRLKQKNTLLIIDHHDLFIKDAANVIVLGEGGGNKGGSVIDTERYIKRQKAEFHYEISGCGIMRNLTSAHRIYNYNGFNVDIAMGALNLIMGESGVGKTTLLREYLPQILDDYLYISQKALTGNVRSTVGTIIGISNLVGMVFSKRFKQGKSFFSNMSGAEGVCKTCSGIGIITFGSDTQSQIVLDCKDCKGTGFNNKLFKYYIKGKNIQDVWLMSIDEGAAFFKDVDEKICATLRMAQKLLLGHLKLSEKTHNLSGGENVRIKLITALSSQNNTIGIDEPFKGLNNEEIYSIVLSLDELVKSGKTVIVADHEESALRYFTNQILLKKINGILTV